ncbi:PREDICTED: period circadian protein isoform X3 [Papilio polytes]|uniref:period circadian protein isoform X3 n=1 Tax=Papilio polytes TaxID=76194 RepID=UPI0006765B08|nr:PREDICTED: period circadian protein isoform X3 [Papilio polytes]
MDSMDDSENNAKISDSAYSNSCSNSQSRRSSKSTHSGSNSSGSSGYGGKPSTSGYSSNNINQPQEKRLKEKDSKKKKQAHTEMLTEVRNEMDDGLPESAPIFETPKEDIDIVVPMSSPALASPEKGSESMDISTSENRSSKGDVEPVSAVFLKFDPDITKMKSPVQKSFDNAITRSSLSCRDGFSCVISMHDGVVMYTTSSLTSTLGFPKDMWVGRSFIDFIHPRDRSVFASQITNGLAAPKNVNVPEKENLVSSMVCRIRRYRDLASGFGVKNNSVVYMPFLLKLSFKNANNEKVNDVYLVIQASPFFSAFKIPNEVVTKPILFIIRHAANGNLEYLDPESVPYLGYLPQDVTDKDALHLYHPHDLVYLRQIYETIVKEGRAPRSKPYRMRAQNGDFVKLETEWSSFINPWSKKLEFVIGKHYIIEGPLNPDVFESPDPERGQIFSEEDRLNAQSLRDSIIKILNEVLTKPAEAAKQQMSKRCQDIAKFMESLLEDQPKNDDDSRVEMQDPDLSYYERDSVMLGGISPHHDYNDSKSSTETPVSYNQLNYNDTLQRYFESHPSSSYEEYNTVTGENVLGMQDPITKERITPPTIIVDFVDDDGKPTKGDENNRNSIGDYQPIRLTESVLSKHNAVMIKELVKIHRENRSSKGDKEKHSNETRQKKKEHLARCNASYQPTSAGVNITMSQPQGVKRSSKQIDLESVAHKHHCTTPRQTRRKQPITTMPHTITTPATTIAPTAWTSNPMNAYILGVGIPQQMSIVSPVAAMPGMFPMHYMQPHVPQMQPSTSTSNAVPGPSMGQQYQEPPMQGMMYGQAMYGSPFMYSPINPQVTYPVAQNFVPSHGVQYVNHLNALDLGDRNYVEACKTRLPMKSGKTNFGYNRKGRKRENQGNVQGSLLSNSSANASYMDSSALSSDKSGIRKSPDNSSDFSFFRTSFSVKSVKAVHDITQNDVSQPTRPTNSEGTIEKTDEDSSYSSFYSSFFKTESGSAEESNDTKKRGKESKSACDSGSSYPGYSKAPAKKGPLRKMQPPWMEHVCVTSELIYKYQIQTKSREEVLLSDKLKLKQLEQPSLVNEQLGQLYLDLQLEGVASRLTLEEGITSSSSSGEENFVGVSKSQKKKREYSKLVMIFEENAPLPPPDSPPAASVS